MYEHRGNYYLLHIPFYNVSKSPDERGKPVPEFKKSTNNYVITIKDVRLYARVSAAAHRHNTTRAEIMRQVVSEWLDKDERDRD
jgi:hypothetical protein